jgi:hypothetical protein
MSLSEHYEKCIAQLESEKLQLEMGIKMLTMASRSRNTNTNFEDHANVISSMVEELFKDTSLYNPQ